MTEHKPTGDLTDMHKLLIRVDTTQGHLQKDVGDFSTKLDSHIDNYNELFVAVDRNSRAVSIAIWLFTGSGAVGLITAGLLQVLK